MEKAMSLIVFILTGLIVGIIAKALVSGRDPETGIMLLIGTAAQLVSWLLLGAIGLGRYGLPWSFFASIGVAAVMLSFYNNAVERSRTHTDIAPPDAGLGVVAPLRPPPPRPFGKRALDATGLAVTGALLMGVTGFLIGFFGPMKYQPWANQGPMVGIFLTGPGGLLLGGIIGTALGFMQPAWSFRRRMWTLNAANVAWGLFVLNLVADRSWWR
jgi:uncharacterized membrane protein YeaQ/YmgE (transglycosylase-associated protein family)